MLPGIDASSAAARSALRGSNSETPAAVTRVIEARATGSAGDVRDEAVARFNRVALGTAFSAEILSRIQGDNFLVRVDGSELSMQLPPGAQPGERLQLNLAATAPNLTFLLTLPGGASAATELSPTARLIDQILQRLSQESASGPLRGTLPLVGAGNPDPAQMATALRNALASSGLFYESHVALWSQGQWDHAALLREPQAQEGRFLLTSYVPDPTGKAVPAGADAAAANSDNAARAIFDGDTARLIGQQLNVLEQGQVHWQGECWPGQRLDWQVHAQPQPESDQSGDASGNGAAPTERSWESVLQLELPRLGTINARLRLSGASLRLQLQAGAESTATLLRSGSGQLADALAQASGAAPSSPDGAAAGASLRLDQLLINAGPSSENSTEAGR